MDLKMGTQILYIPSHVKVYGSVVERLDHPDVEAGFVTGKCPSSESYFCRYWSKHAPHELRTTANSEATPPECIRVYDTHEQIEVDVLLGKLGYT